MTRKRDRRSSPSSFRSRNPPAAAVGPKKKGRGAEAAQALKRTGARDRPGERREAKVSLIYGFHSVGAALKAPRRELIRLYATAAAAERLSGEIAARGLETRIMSPEDISARAPREAVHQGLLLEARPLAPIEVADLPANGLALVLDQITDPHNVGAILRTGAAFAVDALVTTERHSPDFAGALAKSASGGLEHVPICSVTNLARALAEMGDMGYWRIGLDSEASDQFAKETISRPLALVLGAEDKGLRRLTRERCDRLVRLDLPGAIKSLNVSNACAIALALAHERMSVKA
ncbi:MAG: 23S rRNA (guanosine(2251)-2'-O)-methyltransferase RlmB [Roseiarcus sp.]